MKKLVINLSVFITFSLAAFLSPCIVIAADEIDDYNEIDDEGYFSNESDFEPELFPLIPDTKRNIVVMGAFATTDEPLLSTEDNSNCSISSAVEQEYEFSTGEKVFFGLAIKNTTTSSKNLKVLFLVTGPIIQKIVTEVTIPAESICMPFTNLPKEIPEGLYKISGFVPGRGRASIIIDFTDRVITPTPATTPTPVPEPTPSQ